MVEMATVTSARVLLCKMRCMFIFTVKTCVLSQKEVLVPLFSCLLAFLWTPGPLNFGAPYILHALPGQTVSDFSTGQQTLPFHYRHYRLFFWLAETSNKPISITTRLAVNPN